MQTLALKPPLADRPRGGLARTFALARGSLRRAAAKELIFVEGDPATHAYCIESGAIALYKVLADGRRQIVGFAYAADVIGLGIDHDHVMSAQAIKPTLLRCMQVETLHRCAAQDPMLGFQLYVAVARELAATRELMLTTGQRSAAERVASFLLALSRRAARSGQDRADLAELELPMTRGDIGDFLGLTIETVSRTFTRLRTLGLIELPHSNRVHLLSVERLEMLAAGMDKQGWHVAPHGEPCGTNAAACVSAPAGRQPAAHVAR